MYHRYLRQEGVGEGAYFAKIVDIETSDGVKTECRTYQHLLTPAPLKPGEELPFCRRPSITYKECIVKGAIECNIPEDYIEFLKKIPHNGKHGPPSLREQLNL